MSCVVPGTVASVVASFVPVMYEALPNVLVRNKVRMYCNEKNDLNYLL